MTTSPWRSALGALADGALDVLLPAVCPACHIAQGPTLCPTCLSSFPLLTHPCPWCGEPRRSADALCGACNGSGLPHIARVWTNFAYADGLSRLIGDAKAGARPAAIHALSLLVPQPGEAGIPGQTAAVVPVPPSRGRRPGPHLATALARVLARRMQVPLRRLLVTTRAAVEQHRLVAGERTRNVEGLFRVVKPPPARVYLVDDLATSGATASAAAAALRHAGAQRVELVCLARTLRK